MNLDLEHVDGSGVPGIMSSSSLVRENCPEQEQCGSDDGYSIGQEFYICSQDLSGWNSLELQNCCRGSGGRGGTQNAMTFNIKTYKGRTL